MTTIHRWKIAGGTVALAVALACAGAGTTPAKGRPCDNPGDVYARHGTVLTCSAPPGGRQGTWR